jgi:hypothetical protein
MKRIIPPDNNDVYSVAEIKLPFLPTSEIEKMDYLLCFMKENKAKYIDVYSVCKGKWGDNRLMYLFFAEYFKSNSFAIVQSNNDKGEYVWMQKISSRGLVLDSFKKEFIRQQERKKIGSRWFHFNSFLSIALVGVVWLRFRSLW